MTEIFNRKIVLEDGTEFYGCGFGAKNDRVCRLVINTAAVGYQEVLSDPSCAGLAMVMTYPLIGNYGITDEDFESKNPTLGMLIVREYCDSPSNFRFTKTLAETMEDYRIPGIYGLDTRKLTRKIRDEGSMRVLITDASMSTERAVETIRNTPDDTDLISKVSCKKRRYSRTANHKYDIVAVDCGIKNSMIEALKKRRCNVTVVPYNTDAAEITALRPDAVVIPNGPGAPEDAKPIIELVKKIKGEIPVLAVGLGFDIVCLAYGAALESRKFCCIGGNHPVRETATGKIKVTSQGDGFMLKEDALKETELEATHINILDETVVGVKSEKDRLLAFQFHPEASPGPQDFEYLFDSFINMTEGNENA
ncbi:MAG: carbamoyl phosphate synthase small subunit [Acutalibacteraceae bacterium]